jgi:hypothetical protein
MSTQVLGGQKRSRTIAAIVALALALAIFLLAAQATSLRSSRGGAQLRPAPEQLATLSSTHAVNGSRIPAGCWVKFGCDRGGTTMSARLGSVRRIPDGCRVKFGCQPDAGGRERH